MMNTFFLVNVSCSYPEECEVATSVDARDLEVAHHDLTVFIVFSQRAILLLQIRQCAQLVLGTSTH